MIQPSDIALTVREDMVFSHLSVSVNRSVELFQSAEDPTALPQAERELRAMLWAYIYGDLESDLKALYDRIDKERICRADVLDGVQAAIDKLQQKDV